jgi:hypothetical protein
MAPPSSITPEPRRTLVQGRVDRTSKSKVEGPITVHAALYKLGRERWEPLDATLGVSSLDLQVPALDVAQFTQHRDEIATSVIHHGRWRRGRAEHPKPVHLPGRLRLATNGAARKARASRATANRIMGGNLPDGPDATGQRRGQFALGPHHPRHQPRTRYGACLQ